MGIYIPNMKKPTKCGECPCFSEEYYYCKAADIEDAYYSGAPDDCPLIPVPPHGRLGDLDVLYEKFSRLEREAMNALKTTTADSVKWWSAVLTERTGYKYDIADAPTIIPAEEGE